MERKQPMRLFCKANTDLNAAVRGDNVILVPADSSDKSQHWLKDSENVGNLTDEQGRRAFALVNRATGQAMMHKDGDVRLAHYQGHEGVDISMVWSLGVKLASGFSEIRVVKHLDRTLNVLKGIAEEGATVGLFSSEPYNDHAIWVIVPINEG